ncbi:WhiB family transcriptional regulator [Streptomyces sp. t39]|uniref:WhiB family transcriptional regulator n=1 Tax=Streptomyces sp. t39 TaxID=1828156 RepID=UPI0011CDD956|nr:WhiB family transcriptional regulator [Streptomyces sp. t39]TXS35600.1 WhiB family transcriptional regulator [Streptomyces sp. t39]
MTTTNTRRPTRSAVEWLPDAVCRTTDPEAFFSDARPMVAAARGVCVNCPVIAECLVQWMGREEPLYRWGVAGGLSQEQRRALYVEGLLGERPQLPVARWLASPAGWPALSGAWKASGRRLVEATRLLRAEGVLASEVTVRVALWWSGERAPRLGLVPSGSSVARAERMAVCEGQVLLRLSGLGVSRRDMAAYFGAQEQTTVNALRIARARQEVAA